MMKNLINLFFCFLLFLVFTMPCWAVPGYINYQGKLTDKNGAPVNGVYIMQFYLYNAETGGSSLWDEQQDIIVANGIFNVKIGDDDPLTNPLLPEYFDNTTPYLEIRIFNSGIGWETLKPRQHLTSTPFAMKSAIADTVVDNSVDTDMLMTNAVTRDKISTNAVGGDELADNAVGANEIMKDAVGKSEIANNAVGTGEIADNAVTASKISPNIVSSVDGVRNDGGNIDLVPGSNIIITPNDSANTITFSAAIPSQYLTRSEGDSRYVNSAGDTMTGDLHVDGTNGIYIGTNDGTNDDFLRMDYGNEFLQWDEVPARFYFSDDLFINGKLSVGGDADTQSAYNRIGTGTPSSNDMNSSADLFVSYDIEAGSEVYAQDFKYTTVKEYVLNIPACEFIKSGSDSDTAWTLSGMYAYTSNNGSQDSLHAVAGVHLPDGAVITRLEIQYYDNHPTEYVNIFLGLYGRNYTSTDLILMAYIRNFNSGTWSGIMSRSTDPIITSTDDQHQYTLELSWDPSGTTFSNLLRFYGARITYTLDKVSN